MVCVCLHAMHWQIKPIPVVSQVCTDARGCCFSHSILIYLTAMKKSHKQQGSLRVTTSSNTEKHTPFQLGTTQVKFLHVAMLLPWFLQGLIPPSLLTSHWLKQRWGRAWGEEDFTLCGHRWTLHLYSLYIKLSWSLDSCALCAQAIVDICMDLKMSPVKERCYYEENPT